MKNTTTPAIYEIFCEANGKRYIGSAVNPQRRYYKHVNFLRRGQHFNSHLQNAWNKYGEDTFAFTLIEQVDNEENLIKQEQYWMDLFQSHETNVGFNKCPTAGSLLGFQHSVETRKKYSIARKGRVFSAESRKRMSNAAKEKWNSKKYRKKMSDANKGNNNPMYGKPVSKSTRRKRSESCARTWQVISPDGESQVIKNLFVFCKKYGLNHGHMSSVASGKRIHHKGWKCNKVGDDE